MTYKEDWILELSIIINKLENLAKLGNSILYTQKAEYLRSIRRRAQNTNANHFTPKLNPTPEFISLQLVKNEYKDIIKKFRTDIYIKNIKGKVYPSKKKTSL